MCSDSSEKLNLDDLIYKGKGLWEDPHKDEPAGVLLSDQIEFYIKEFRLVAPYDPEALRPAQYTLRVGEEGYCAGSKFKIDKQNPLIIPPNGLVYIKIYEYFNIPYYMIARYSLRVEQVYRGLIVDNGLQVDPGYHGHINVPVYNFTNEDKKLEFYERILSVEFVKTTVFKPDPPIDAKKEREWVCSGLINENGYPFKLFKEKPDKLYFQKSISEHFRNKEKNESSVLELKNTVENFTKKVKQMKKWGIWGAVGIAVTVIAIIVSLMGYIYTTHDSFAQARIDAENARSAVKLQQVEVEKINVEITELEEKGIELEKARSNHIKELQNKISELENSLSELQNKKEKY